ncbi:MAG: hypothetical protein OEY49_17355 [Candidatus Heimdallarchaeota archaeon]|nr:hypothetical protein [Candidatus Heimdallarchaeota archaeon]
MDSEVYNYELDLINKELIGVMDKILVYEEKHTMKFYQFERIMFDDNDIDGECWEDYFDWKSLAHRKKMLKSKINQLKKLFQQQE